MKAKKPNKALKPKSISEYVKVAKLIVKSATNEDGDPLYPRKWNNAFIGIPPVIEESQNRPYILAETICKLANYPVVPIAVLVVLLAATGMRISEMLAIEIDKHISDDFRTITISQQVVYREVTPTLKTIRARREVDLYSKVSNILKWFIGDRGSGFLFAARTGEPLLLNNLYTQHLHPALQSLGYNNKYNGTHKAGFTIFRRYRVTYLNNYAFCPDGLRAFWLGHKSTESGQETQRKVAAILRRDMGHHYDMIAQDRPRRLEMAELCGIGFDLPSFVPNVPNSGVDSDGSQNSWNERVDWWI